MQKFVRPGAEVRAPVAPGRPPGIHGDLTIARAVFTRYRACAVLERERERERERKPGRDRPSPVEALENVGEAQGRPRRAS